MPSETDSPSTSPDRPVAGIGESRSSPSAIRSPRIRRSAPAPGSSSGHRRRCRGACEPERNRARGPHDRRARRRRALRPRRSSRPTPSATGRSRSTSAIWRPWAPPRAPRCCRWSLPSVAARRGLRRHDRRARWRWRSRTPLRWSAATSPARRARCVVDVTVDRQREAAPGADPHRRAARRRHLRERTVGAAAAGLAALPGGQAPHSTRGSCRRRRASGDAGFTTTTPPRRASAGSSSPSPAFASVSFSRKAASSPRASTSVTGWQTRCSSSHRRAGSATSLRPSRFRCRTLCRGLWREELAPRGYHGGEDYELLFTSPPRRRRALLAALQHAQGVALTRIGRITRDRRLVLRKAAGEDEALPRWVRALPMIRVHARGRSQVGGQDLPPARHAKADRGGVRGRGLFRVFAVPRLSHAARPVVRVRLQPEPGSGAGGRLLQPAVGHRGLVHPDHGVRGLAPPQPAAARVWRDAPGPVRAVAVPAAFLGPPVDAHAAAVVAVLRGFAHRRGRAVGVRGTGWCSDMSRRGIGCTSRGSTSKSCASTSSEGGARTECLSGFRTRSGASWW